MPDNVNGVCSVRPSGLQVRFGVVGIHERGQGEECPPRNPLGGAGHKRESRRGGGTSVWAGGAQPGARPAVGPRIERG